MNINKLTSLAKITKTRAIASLFDNKHRSNDFSLSTPYLYLDYSKQNINEVELEKLVEIAVEAGLARSIKNKFRGDKINNTENRAVLHTVLRAPKNVQQQVLGSTLANEVEAGAQKMVNIVDDVHSGKLTSYSGKQFTDVLAIGIGGSYYGVKVGLSALEHYRKLSLSVHVIANVDGGALEEKLKKLTPETTLVVVISKTFTTQETLLNAQAVKAWMLSNIAKKTTLVSTHTIIEKQWFAVSNNTKAAKEFGISEQHILPMWDWVGGRFSLWSTVGLPLALAIGNESFRKLKQGAYEMDLHFNSADFNSNMPVIMALLGIWNRNALGYPALAILPYAHSLRALPGYLQQTDMESNGKSVSTSGDKLSWSTAPVVFGQEGTNGQHAFMQLMHQSDDIIPTDFIVALKGRSQFTENHKVLVANCFAQSEALMQGKSLVQVKSELAQSGLSPAEIDSLAPHKTMKGNTPSNTIVLEQLTPETLGALLALYEHKIFVQGVLWQVNSFDQWGVELGKQLGSKVLSVMDGAKDDSLSASSQSLIARFKAK